MEKGKDDSPRLPLSDVSASRQYRKLVVVTVSRLDVSNPGVPPLPSPAVDHDGILKREARQYFAALESENRPRIAGEHDCWEMWGPGVPCLHPDGLGHLGPHGMSKC